VYGDYEGTVRSDGSGNFTSVQAALNWVAGQPQLLTSHVTLRLLGAFRERVHVYSNFTGGIALLGDGAAPVDALIINSRAGTAYGTFDTCTVCVDANDFNATNVAIANDAGGYDKVTAGQSVALALNGDRSVVLRSALLGGQDTLYTGTQRSYFYQTHINGSCDSVFGEGSSVFEGCEVSIFDTVTAHKGNGSTAYLFVNSSIVPVGQPQYPSRTFLGRPWGPLSRTVFSGCFMGDAIQPAGSSTVSRASHAGHPPL